ncbi:hypothetical protein B0T25DRAFT_572257 [Lasiosphaeria hispida]|uniref:Major facilitator superfamily (MFS) profile domain-containing protein n=1 Tax=Lasiosphaeria hispida TaxID=260671 RepID=A0AAJ0MBE3_9PEZI|nr:hypothetical protein B0T25DRAFT_572257 [Lasiosphaeria hispida]
MAAADFGDWSVTGVPQGCGSKVQLLLPAICTIYDRHQIAMIGCAPMVMVEYSIFLGTTNPTARYSATFLVTSSLYALGPITNAQVSANVISDTSRASAIGLNVMMGNIGGMVSTWSFLPSDAPSYPICNGLKRRRRLEPCMGPEEALSTNVTDSMANFNREVAKGVVLDETGAMPQADVLQV